MTKLKVWNGSSWEQIPNPNEIAGEVSTQVGPAVTAAIDAEPRISQLVTDVGVIDTSVAKGDKKTTLKSAFYEPVADGVTDDRAALQALLTDGAGGTVTIARGNYAITGPLTVADSTEVVIQPGTVIEQKTKYNPVFDVFNADDVVIHGNGALLTWTGSRAWTASGSFRGDTAGNYGSGVWSNGNRVKFHDLRSHGFTCGVYLSAWNGTSLGDYGKYDNEVHNLTVEDVDFGVLFGGQVNPVIKSVRGSYSLQVGSSNPSHLLYATSSGKSRNIDIDGFRANAGTGGGAFQLKHVDGGRVMNMHAINCEGLISIDSCNDLVVDSSATGDKGLGEGGSVYIFGTTKRCTVNANISAAETSTGFCMVNTDSGVSDTVVNIKGRQRQPAASGDFSVRLRGSRNVVNYAVDNLDNSNGVYTSGGRPCVYFMSGERNTLNMIHARGVEVLARVDAGATNCVINLDGAQIETTTGAQTVLNNEPTTSLRREGMIDVPITAGGQDVRVDGFRFRTVYVNVTTTGAFSITWPYGGATYPRGTRITYIISNKSGGAMGTVSWVQHTLSSTWTSPASAQEKSIEFIWDGVRWKEIGRTG